jgi:hypothetical protein
LDNRSGTAICALMYTAQIADMSAQPIQDANDGKPWSEMDLFDLRNSLAYVPSARGLGWYRNKS